MNLLIEKYTQKHTFFVSNNIAENLLGLDAINNFNLSVGKTGFYIECKPPIKPVMYFMPDPRNGQVNIESEVHFA